MRIGEELSGCWSDAFFGKEQCESAAFANLRVNQKLGLMPGRHMLDNCQAQASAARFA